MAAVEPQPLFTGEELEALESLESWVRVVGETTDRPAVLKLGRQITTVCRAMRQIETTVQVTETIFAGVHTAPRALFEVVCFSLENALPTEGELEKALCQAFPWLTAVEVVLKDGGGTDG